MTPLRSVMSGRAWGAVATPRGAVIASAAGMAEGVATEGAGIMWTRRIGDAEEAQEEHATHDAETPPSRQHRAVRLASIGCHLADHGLASSAGGTAGGRGFTASCT